MFILSTAALLFFLIYVKLVIADILKDKKRKLPTYLMTTLNTVIWILWLLFGISFIGNLM